MTARPYMNSFDPRPILPEDGGSITGHPKYRQERLFSGMMTFYLPGGTFFDHTPDCALRAEDGAPQA